MRTSTAKVTMIPAILRQYSAGPADFAARKRVAAYARVSTDTEEQLSSYEAQVDHYTRYIQSNPEWEFVEVYADEGISATSTKKRKEFNRMIADALDGKIDLIITKSVSRFARNTVDTLTTVRQLKEKGVEVFFEKENIYTLDSKGELLITIMSSLAQEESRSISENVTWGQRKRFADGKVSLPYKRFLGYEKGEGEVPKIVEDQAKIVRLIYKLFLEGGTPTSIAKQLTSQGIPTPSGKHKWQNTTVESILTNEKYKGDAILQKSYTVDFLTKKVKVNEGEVPQYYVENSHPAIVSPEVFDLVQQEVKRRKTIGYTSNATCFSNKILCGDCGGFYGSKVWHSTSKYRRTIWQCNRKFKNRKKCGTPHLGEETLKRAFVDAFNSMIENKDEILDGYHCIIQTLTDTSALYAEAEKLQSECDVVLELMRKCVEENAHIALDQEEYERRYGVLAARYEDVKKRLESANEQRLDRKDKYMKLMAFIDSLKRSNLLTEFDEELWNAAVDLVTVYSEQTLVFTFKDGTELQWTI